MFFAFYREAIFKSNTLTTILELLRVVLSNVLYVCSFWKEFETFFKQSHRLNDKRAQSNFYRILKHVLPHHLENF